MRSLGVDLGEKRIGLALSDPQGILASPFRTVPRGDDGELLATLTELARREGADVIVVGLPLSLSGEAGPQAREAQAFCQRLREHSKLTVVAWDERLTTVAAERALIEGGVRRARRRERRDAVAAALMLQGYLDKQRFTPKEAP